MVAAHLVSLFCWLNSDERNPLVSFIKILAVTQVFPSRVTYKQEFYVRHLLRIVQRNSFIQFCISVNVKTETCNHDSLPCLFQWICCGHLHHQFSRRVPVRSRKQQGQYHCGGEQQAAAEDFAGEIKSYTLHLNTMNNYLICSTCQLRVCKDLVRSSFAIPDFMSGDF